MYIEDLIVGASHEEVERILQHRIDYFCSVSGDDNPIHTDLIAGLNSVFGSIVAPGMLGLSMAMGVIGSKFPGHGTIWTNISEFKCLAPIRPGDTLHIVVTVLEKPEHEQKKHSGGAVIHMRGAIYGDTVFEGKALIRLPRKEIAAEKK